MVCLNLNCLHVLLVHVHIHVSWEGFVNKYIHRNKIIFHVMKRACFILKRS